MSEPIIHPSTYTQIKALLKHMPQSLLLSGQYGVGLATIAKWMAGRALAGNYQPRNSKGEIDSQGTVSVEVIRDLYAQTRAKQTSPRIYLIDDADRMSTGAQAAFLKLLEEPTPNTHFFLTSHQPQKLLSTIPSRTQRLQVLPVTGQQTDDFIQRIHGINDATKKAQLAFIAGGLPAEICRLIENAEAFTSRAKIVADARTFLQADPYAKLLLIQEYQSDRGRALQLIDDAIRILRRTASASGNASLIRQLQALLEIHDRVATQHNIRLQLAGFVV